MRALALRLPRLGVGPQIVIVSLVLSLLGAMAIEPTRQLLEQRERISGMASDLDEIERSNRRLDNRIERLLDPDFIEQRARDFGLVRPGETSIVVMPPSRHMQDEKPKRAVPKPSRPQPLGFFDGLLNFIGLF